MQIIIEHECKDMENEFAYIFKDKQSWRLIIEDYGDSLEINYCPLCGKKLYKEEGESGVNAR